ncbi:MAG: hypothetical protein JW798_12900, partial [Prolixibacteraceae bacterium]|nr:hypothetical protein [Prolixibacteraceae bacterium]
MKKILDKIITTSVWNQMKYLVVLLLIIGVGFYFVGEWVKITYLTEMDVVLSKLNDNTSEPSFFDKVWYISSRILDPGYIGESKDKLFALLITALGWIFCTGLLIAIITNAYFQRIEKVAEGLTRYRFKNHCVIIGNNEMTISLIKQIVDWEQFDYRNSIVVHTEQGAKDVRASLRSHLPRKVERKLYIYTGARDSEEELGTLCLETARLAFVLGEPDERGGDSRNVECAKLISKHLQKNSYKGKPLTCYLYIENQTTFNLLQQYDLPTNIQKKIDLKVFNQHESWANKVLVKGENLDGTSYLPLDYEPITMTNKKEVRMVIVGFNRMGQALAIQAARIAHFGRTKTSTITIIDKVLQERKDTFLSQFPGINEIIGVKFEFIEGSVEAPEIRGKLEKWAKDQNEVLTVAVCLSDADESLFLGLNLPFDVYERGIPVLIRQEMLHGFASAMASAPGGKQNMQVNYPEERFTKVKFFGMLADACDLNFERDEIAKLLHDYYIEMKKADGSYRADDPSCQPWEELPEYLKWSNRYIIDIYNVKLRALANSSEVFQKCNYSIKEYGNMAGAVFLKHFKPEGSQSGVLELSDADEKCILKDIELLAEIEHNRWIAERVLAGWKFAEGKKDLNRLTSPFIRAYIELDEEIKNYDREPSLQMFKVLEGDKKVESK